MAGIRGPLRLAWQTHYAVDPSGSLFGGLGHRGLAFQPWSPHDASPSVALLHRPHFVRAGRMWRLQQAVHAVVARRELPGSLRPDQRREAAHCRWSAVRDQARHDQRGEGREVIVLLPERGDDATRTY